MDVLGAAASIAGVAALGVGAWQLRVAVMDRRDAHARHQGHTGSEADSGPDSGPPVPATIASLPVTPPVGRLPAEILGRTALLAELRDTLRRRARRPGRAPGRVQHAWVLAGMGGIGKSTAALWLSVEARQRGWSVWWVNAADPTSLRGGLLEILRRLDGPETVAREVRDGAPTAADRFWAFLERTAPLKRPALLIFDNADAPAVLSADGQSTPADGTGWIRPATRVVTLVTTRHGDPRTWGPRVQLRRLEVLDAASAADVLRSLAPEIPDRDAEEVLALARRLGALPLALHLAGTYLASPFARWHRFGDYLQALDSDLAADAVADLDTVRTDPRAAVSRTWELSLDALADQGLGEARGLLYLLACFSPATPIPAALLPSPGGHRRLAEILRALTDVGLIDVIRVPGSELPEVVVHPVVADTCRARLLDTGRTEAVTAVELTRAACEDLDSELPSDWSSWERLLPHVRALLQWAAPALDDRSLTVLLGFGRQAFGALWLDGHRASADGEGLARASLAAAGRLGEGHPDLLAARHDIAIELFVRGQYAKAEDAFRAVLADRRRVLGETHVDTLLTRDKLIGAVLSQGRYLEAEQLYRELIDVQKRALGAQHPDTLTTFIDLAWSIGMQDRYDEAEEICRETLEAARRALGDKHPRTLDAWADLARWTSAAGALEEAEAICRQFLEVAHRTLITEHPLTLSTQATLARTLETQGQHDEAERMLRDALERMEHHLGDDNLLTISTQRDLATMMSTRGHAHEAAQIYRQVLELQQRMLGPEHPETLITRRLLNPSADETR